MEKKVITDAVEICGYLWYRLRFRRQRSKAGTLVGAPCNVAFHRFFRNRPFVAPDLLSSLPHLWNASAPFLYQRTLLLMSYLFAKAAGYKTVAKVYNRILETPTRCTPWQWDTDFAAEIYPPGLSYAPTADGWGARLEPLAEACGSCCGFVRFPEFPFTQCFLQ